MAAEHTTKQAEQAAPSDRGHPAGIGLSQPPNTNEGASQGRRGAPQHQGEAGVGADPRGVTKQQEGQTEERLRNHRSSHHHQQHKHPCQHTTEQGGALRAQARHQEKPRAGNAHQGAHAPDRIEPRGGADIHAKDRPAVGLQHRLLQEQRKGEQRQDAKEIGHLRRCAQHSPGLAKAQLSRAISSRLLVIALVVNGALHANHRQQDQAKDHQGGHHNQPLHPGNHQIQIGAGAGGAQKAARQNRAGHDADGEHGPHHRDQSRPLPLAGDIHQQCRKRRGAGRDGQAIAEEHHGQHQTAQEHGSAIAGLGGLRQPQHRAASNPKQHAEAQRAAEHKGGTPQPAPPAVIGALAKPNAREGN